MDKLGEIKNIIRGIPYRFRESKDPDIEKDVDTVARQICQLFPKTKDNPDGYEPKQRLATPDVPFVGIPQDEDEELMKEGYLAMAEAHRESVSLNEPKERLLTDEELTQAVQGEWNATHLRVAQAQLAKDASTLQVDAIIYQEYKGLVDAVVRLEAQVKQQEAKCQQKIEKIFKKIEEIICSIVPRHLLIINSYRWQALKAKYLGGVKK